VIGISLVALAPGRDAEGAAPIERLGAFRDYIMSIEPAREWIRRRKCDAIYVVGATDPIPPVCAVLDVPLSESAHRRYKESLNAYLAELER
jgi:hypothetical protein